MPATVHAPVHFNRRSRARIDRKLDEIDPTLEQSRAAIYVQCILTGFRGPEREGPGLHVRARGRLDLPTVTIIVRMGGSIKVAHQDGKTPGGGKHGQGKRVSQLDMLIYIYIYICLHTHTHIYVHLFVSVTWCCDLSLMSICQDSILFSGLSPPLIYFIPTYGCSVWVSIELFISAQVTSTH